MGLQRVTEHARTNALIIGKQGASVNLTYVILGKVTLCTGHISRTHKGRKNS